VETHFASLGLPTRSADIPGGQGPDAATLLKIMGQDKKVRGGALTLILARGIGEAFISRDVVPNAVLDFLARQAGR
jgi:3-dehydroquinate synthetase